MAKRDNFLTSLERQREQESSQRHSTASAGTKPSLIGCLQVPPSPLRRDFTTVLRLQYDCSATAILALSSFKESRYNKTVIFYILCISREPAHIQHRYHGNHQWWKFSLRFTPRLSHDARSRCDSWLVSMVTETVRTAVWKAASR